MSNDKTTTIGLIVLLFIALFVGWRFIAPTAQSGGGGGWGQLPPIQLPNIISPVINIDLGGSDGYQPVIEPTTPLPTCGCINSGDIGADWKTLPVFNYTAPVVQRYEPVKASVSIPLNPVDWNKKNYVVYPGSMGMGKQFFSVYVADNYEQKGDKPPTFERGKAVWSGYLALLDTPWTGEYNMPARATMKNGVAIGAIPWRNESFFARAGIMGSGLNIIVLMGTMSYSG